MSKNDKKIDFLKLRRGTMTGKTNTNKNNTLILFIKNIKLPIIKNIFRPKDIPLIVPDCGWNHGEQKEK
jgi:hypothetical protein